jgi:hypothetical protein
LSEVEVMSATGVVDGEASWRMFVCGPTFELSAKNWLGILCLAELEDR